MSSSLSIFDKVKETYLYQGKSIRYLTLSLSILTILIVLTYALPLLPNLFKIPLAAISIALSGRFFWLSHKMSNSISKDLIALLGRFFLLSYKMIDSILEDLSAESLEKGVISISSDSHHESLNIQGDNIGGDLVNGNKIVCDNIGGDLVNGNKIINKNIHMSNQINLNRSPSEIIEEIRQVLTKLAKNPGSLVFAEQRIVDEILNLSSDKKEVERKIIELAKFLELDTSGDTTEIAENIIEFLTPATESSFWNISFAVNSNKVYRRLIYLLEASKWKEGDEETVRVIKKLMPHSIKRSGCLDIDVTEISVKQLKAINKIWLEASGGKFGFSVQKRIWNKINRLTNDQEWIDGTSNYDIFAEQVGWSNDMGVIYHIDFDYTIIATKGSLPAKILLLETYDPNSNYCRLSLCLFDIFMERKYSDYSFIPDKIREWLVLE